MTYETILTEQRDSYAVIRLNRPQALNALNSLVLKELLSALQQIDADGSVKCSIITGSEKAFAAGADIKEMMEKDAARMFADDQFRPFYEMQKIRKPVIAAVSGFALGGGCELVMACDIILAAESAKFGQPEINLGVIPGMGGSQRLTRAVGKARAMELLLTGDMFSAADALAWGLINRVVPNEALLSEAEALAKKIAGKPLQAIIASKEMVNAAQELPLTDGLTLERRRFVDMFDTDDQKEGMKAFTEKRKAGWRDR